MIAVIHHPVLGSNAVRVSTKILRNVAICAASNAKLYYGSDCNVLCISGQCMSQVRTLGSAPVHQTNMFRKHSVCERQNTDIAQFLNFISPVQLLCSRFI